jgi:C4-dicarboxylate-specific signal transduction histidine kinase
MIIRTNMNDKKTKLKILVRQYGPRTLIFGLTLVSIFFSVLMTTFVRLLIFNQVRAADYFVGICIPAVLVPLASSFFIFLIRDLDHSETTLSNTIHELNIVSKRAESIADFLQQIFKAVPGHIATIGNDGIYMSSNHFKNQDIFNQAEIIGQKVGEVERSSELSRRLKEFRESAEATHCSEVNLSLDDGQSSWWLLSMTRFSQQRNSDLLLVMFDIQSLKTMELQLATQRALTIHTSRLAAIGEMASGVAHEINNPLTIIQGRTSVCQLLIEKDNIDLNRFKSNLNSIQETTLRIAKIISGLKTFANSNESAPNQDIQLETLLTAVLNLTRARLDANSIDLMQNFDILALNSSVVGNLSQLMQVMIHLINSSFDAIQGANGAWIKIEALNHDQFIEIGVVDSGHGVASDIKSRLMEPFATTKQVGKGTGLGLSVSLGIMKAHGGSLLYDESSTNTRFSIRIPKIYT